MSELPATSIFWQLACNFSSQLLAGFELVFAKKLHASTPPPITLMAGNSANPCAARTNAHLRTGF
jgi:hypothetical protein